MGRLCILDDCSTNSSLLKPRDGMLHRFPSDPYYRKKWEEWVHDVGGPNLKNFVATKSTHLLCNKHFKPSDYLRHKLSFNAVPSLPPKSSLYSEVSSPVNRSMSLPRSLLSPKVTEVSCSVNKPTPLPRLDIATKQNANPSSSPVNNCASSLVRLQPSIVQKNTDPAYSFAVMKPPINGQLIRDGKISQQQGNNLVIPQILQSSDFECPVKAQKYLKLASDENEKARHKLLTMQLKYIRAMKRIDTLKDILNRFKEEKDPVDNDAEIKVCSSCRKVNVCH